MPLAFWICLPCNWYSINICWGNKWMNKQIFREKRVRKFSQTVRRWAHNMLRNEHFGFCWQSCTQRRWPCQPPETFMSEAVIEHFSSMWLSCQLLLERHWTKGQDAQSRTGCPIHNDNNSDGSCPLLKMSFTGPATSVLGRRGASGLQSDGRALIPGCTACPSPDT